MKKHQIRKLRDIILAIAVLILGIIITICNICHIAPGFDSGIEWVITTIIAYGLFIGDIMIVCSIAALDKILATDYRRKLQRKIR
ncbi:MAG: hypothetical protein IJE05_05965 [Clostridia bacterium]|nr:hypothetical protein [Clostridia bacterium]